MSCRPLSSRTFPLPHFVFPDVLTNNFIVNQNTLQCGTNKLLVLSFRTVPQTRLGQELIRLKLFITYSHFYFGFVLFLSKKRKERKAQYCKVDYVFRLCLIRSDLRPRTQFHYFHDDDCFCIALLTYASFIRSTWSFNNFFIYFASNKFMIQSFEEFFKNNYIINY